MTTKTVTLLQPILFHDSQVAAITFREPTLFELLDFGEPYEAQTVKGGRIVIENGQAIRSYMERCIVDRDAGILAMVKNVADARALKEAITGFFRVAAASSDDTTTSSSD